MILVDYGVTRWICRIRDVWDKPAMESVLVTMKTERTTPRPYRTGSGTEAQVLNCFERFNARRRQYSTISRASPVDFSHSSG